MQRGALIFERLDDVIPGVDRECSVSCEPARQNPFIGTALVFS
jgi:hypothetical protein